MCCSGFSSGLQASHRRSVVRTCSYESLHNHLLQHPVSFPFLLHWSHFPVLLLHGGSEITLVLTTTLMYRSSSCKRSYDRGVGSTRSTVVPELVLTCTLRNDDETVPSEQLKATDSSYLCPECSLDWCEVGEQTKKHPNVNVGQPSSVTEWSVTLCQRAPPTQVKNQQVPFKISRYQQQCIA